MLMRSYAADLDARLAGLDDQSGERLIDDLTFAEGRLLHGHPSRTSTAVFPACS